MFNIHVADYKSHRLTFELDSDTNFWFFIRASDGQAVDAASIFPIEDGALVLKTYGTWERFVREKAIPDANAALERVFGKVSPPTEGSKPADKLRFALESIVVFDAATGRLKAK